MGEPTALRRASRIALVFVTIAAAPLTAQQRVILDWTGRVDSVARITIQGGGAHISLVGREDNGAGTLRVRNDLPHRDGRITVQVAEGRGDVDVVQQPSADNDYTAILRLVDRSGGADRYHLTALWAPTNGNRTESFGDVDRDDRPGRRDVRNVGLLHWTGDVDRTVVIRWRGDRTTLQQDGDGAAPQNVRSDVAGAGLPARDVTLRIVKRQGRDDVVIEQQPTAANNYTGVIRVNDTSNGYGHYDFDVIFDRR